MGTPRIGLIADTHNYLDPKVGQVFAGVDHILHAGDVGMPWVATELEGIAPLTLVSGNTDDALGWPETAAITLFGHRFYLQHIVDPRSPDHRLRSRLEQLRPDVVVFGHTHQPFCDRIDGVLFLNPGSAGRRRFATPRSLAVLHCYASGLEAEFVRLETP